MRHGIVVDLAPILVGVVHTCGTERSFARRAVFSLKVNDRSIAMDIVILLRHDGLSKRVEIRVGLLEQVGNTRILGSVDKLEIGL